MEDKGFFIFSMDTELAEGHFDNDEARHRLFSQNGSIERETIIKLIDLFEEFNIRGTWAVVGHLFYDKCEYCKTCPMMDWKGRYSSFEEVYGTNNPLWYGADIVELLHNRGVKQEIGFHGYSHKIFDENLMTRQDAKIEVQEWLRVGTRKSITPYSVVFPRNQIGHLDVFKEAGMICYRSEPVISWLHQNKYFGKYLKTIDQFLGITNIPIFDLTYRENHGLVILQPSQYLFDINRKIELFFDSMNLHHLRITRIIRGIKKAAKEKKIIHIWAHPYNFRTEKDFLKLRQIFMTVSEEVNLGRMQSVGMAEMARLLVNSNTV